MKGNLSLTLWLALAAFSLFAVAAQAGTPPVWLSEGKPIGTKPVTVKTAGTLTFDLTQFGVSVSCKVKDKELIENPATGAPGTDEMTEFKLSGCKQPKGTVLLCKKPTKLEVIATALPWHSHLLSEPPVVRDVLEGVAVEVHCSKKGASYGTFTGTLDPKVGNSVLEFEGGKGLSGEFGTVTVSGKDTMTGPAGDKKITAK